MPAIEFTIDDDFLLDEIFDLSKRPTATIKGDSLIDDSLLDEIFDLSEHPTASIKGNSLIEEVAEPIECSSLNVPVWTEKDVKNLTYDEASCVCFGRLDKTKTKYFDILRRAKIPMMKEAKYYSHIIMMHSNNDTSFGVKVQCDTKEQFLALYRAAFACPDFSVNSNCEQWRERCIYLDIDADKENCKLTKEEVDFVILAATFVVEYASGLKIEPLILDKTNNGNIHLVFPVVLFDGEISPHIIQRTFVGFLHQIIKETAPDDLRQSEMLKACDNAVGIRGPFVAKEGNMKDYYKPKHLQNRNMKQWEFVNFWALYDPAFTFNRPRAHLSWEFREQALVLMEKNTAQKNLYVSKDEFVNKRQVSDIFKLIDKIPIKWLETYWKWQHLVGLVFSAKISPAIEQADIEYNQRIEKAFDDRSKKAKGYDADNNARYYDIAKINKAGMTELRKRLTSPQSKESYLQYLLKLEECKQKNPGNLKSKYNPTIVDTEHTNFPLLNGAIIKANTGTGKSFMSREFLNEQFEANPNLKVLIIGNRIKLLKKTQDLLRAHQFVWYDKLKSGDPQSRVISTCESLHLVENIWAFDYVFMDEFCSIIAQLDSPNFHFPVQTMQAFHLLFESQAKFVLMDAYMNDYYLDILFRNFPEMQPPAYYINTRQNKIDEEMTILVDKVDVSNTIKRLIAEKKNIVFCSDRVKNVEVIGKILAEDGKTLILTSERCKAREMQDILQNPALITEYKHFCYSPVIEAGFSIDIEHFDVQVSSFTYQATSLIGNLQMLNRVRVKKDRKNFVFFQKQGKSVKTADEIVKSIAARACNDKISNSMTEFGAIPWESGWRIIHPISQMIVDYRVQKSFEYAKYSALFIQALFQQGYKVSLYSSKPKFEDVVLDNKQYKAISQLIDKEKAEQIAANVAMIPKDKKNFERAVMDGSVFENTLLSYQKGLICETYKLRNSEVSADFVEKYGKPKKLMVFRRLAGIKRIGIEAEIARLEKKIWETNNCLADDEVGEFTADELNLKRLHGGVSLQDKRIAMCVMQEFYGSTDNLDSLKLKGCDIVSKAKNVSIPNWGNVCDRFKVKEVVKYRNFVNFNEINDKRLIIAAINRITSIFGISLKPTNKHCTFYKVHYNGYHPDWAEFMKRWDLEDKAKALAALPYPPPYPPTKQVESDLQKNAEKVQLLEDALDFMTLDSLL